MNLSIKEQEDPKILENTINRLRKEYKFSDLSFPEDQLKTMMKSQLMKLRALLLVRP
jgi:hypothetical protein